MMITFTANGWEDYLYWQKQDRRTLKRINELIKDIQRNGFVGKGKSEPLKGNLSEMWSKRIDSENRLVFTKDKGTVVMYSCRFHDTHLKRL